MINDKSDVPSEMLPAKNGDATEPDVPSTVSRRGMLAQAVSAVAAVIGAPALMHLARIDSVVAWADSNGAKAAQKAMRRKAERAISKSPVGGSVRYEELQGKMVDSGTVQTHVLPGEASNSPSQCVCSGCSCVGNMPAYGASQDATFFSNLGVPVEPMTWGRLKALFRR